MPIVQVTIVLREKLEAIGVEVSVETFEEDQGIAALGEDPFVSCTMVHVVRTCNINNTLKHSLLSETCSTPEELSGVTSNTFRQKHYSASFP